MFRDRTAMNEIFISYFQQKQMFVLRPIHYLNQPEKHRSQRDDHIKSDWLTGCWVEDGCCHEGVSQARVGGGVGAIKRSPSVGTCVTKPVLIPAQGGEE